jgi:hypothetical protein
MKKLISTFLLILTVCVASSGSNVVAQGQSNSDFGDYKIIKLEEHLVIDGKEFDKYLISYDQPDRKVIVVVNKLKKCKKYYLLTGKLAVQYKCDGKLFGIMKLDKKIRDKGFATTSDDMNYMEFDHQKVVASGTTKTIDHLNLIAACYPRLVTRKID